MKSKPYSGKLALSITASILAACGASAFEVPLTSINTNMPPIDVHGFASQGYLLSSDYNYLGNDTGGGSFQFTEAGLNASINPFPRTRITAQAFTYDIGPDVGKFDVVLDYASLEYTFNDYVGIRAGRIRRPEGIYNDIQDVDLARTFVLLPQGIYDSRWRDFYVSMDGADVFGTIPMGKAGNLSYDLYAGMLNPANDGGIAAKVRSLIPSFIQFDRTVSNPQIGEQLWWNTPVNGLRFGVGAGDNINFGWDLVVKPPHAPPQLVSDRYNIPFVQGSAEYRWKSWTFQAEYFNFTLLPDGGGYAQESDAWYASAAYRFNKWVEAGVYYTECYDDVEQRDNSQLYQKDAALALRFDLKSWWIFKVEGHYIQGTGLLQYNNQPTPQDDRGWFMLAVKTTFSF